MHGDGTAFGPTGHFRESLLTLAKFRFKHFTIYHNQDSFSVGTDAMVLGALVQGQNPGRILDAGSGSGVLGLMAAQKFNLSQIDCVEIDEKAFLECQENVRKSPFQDRVTAVHSNLLEYQPQELYTTIVTNPPYYSTDNFSNPRNQREKHLSTEELHAWFAHCIQLLAPHGTLWFIAPVSITKVVNKLIQRLETYVHHEVQIQNQHDRPVRTVYGISKQSNPKKNTLLKLRNSDGSYSDEYIDLTAEFHGITLQKQPKLHETSNATCTFV
ncbi:MAG: hypothetical protein EBU82_06905 [Flavobacteriia bacterium]|nr:hypothetical protein [Flavobacteriia bacterium]